jgi:hypothetical protein
MSFDPRMHLVEQRLELRMNGLVLILPRGCDYTFTELTICKVDKRFEKFTEMIHQETKSDLFVGSIESPLAWKILVGEYEDLSG